MRKHLLSLGYKAVGSRAFSPPDGGPIVILTKKTRFGGRLRRGKSEGVGKGASRYIPVYRPSGVMVGG